jgi:hypothetical protein
MTEPRWISLCERRDLVDGVAAMIRGVTTEFPGAEVWYATLFQRFVTRCCDEHMTEDNVVVIDRIRLGVM